MIAELAVKFVCLIWGTFRLTYICQIGWCLKNKQVVSDSCCLDAEALGKMRLSSFVRISSVVSTK